MANNTTAAGPVDPTKSKRYPIYLGDSILKKDGEGQSLYTGVRCGQIPITPYGYPPSISLTIPAFSRQSQTKPNFFSNDCNRTINYYYGSLQFIYDRR